MTPKKTLYKWFSNFMKPAQEHFKALIDSFWHKSEKIPMSSIDGLSTAIENTASAKQLLNHLDDTNAHRNLFDKKVDKEDGKGLSANDFTNEHKQKLEGLQPTDVSGLLPKGGYEGTGQELKQAIDGLQTKMQQVETTLSVDDTAFDTLQEIATQVKSNKNLEQLLTGKMDKEEGKGLSTNDFTNELKSKLEGLSPLAGSFFGANLIKGNTKELNSSSITVGLPTVYDLCTPFDLGKYLLSFKVKSTFGKTPVIGDGITVKLIGDTEKEVNATLLYNEVKTGVQYYLIENKEEEGQRTYDVNTKRLKITIEGATLFEDLHLKRFLNFPKWEAAEGFYNAYAVYCNTATQLLNEGRCNVVDRGVAKFFYKPYAMFTVVKSDDENVTIQCAGGWNEGSDNISVQIIGDTEITGKAGSRAEIICINGGRAVIIVHNRV